MLNAWPGAEVYKILALRKLQEKSLVTHPRPKELNRTYFSNHLIFLLLLKDMNTFMAILIPHKYH